MQRSNYPKAPIRYARNRSGIKTRVVSCMSQEKPHIKGVFSQKGHNSPGQYGEKLSRLRKLPVQKQRGQEGREELGG